MDRITNDTVSVIILSYNKFTYIYEAIDSVLCQTYPSIELIIADDCSQNFPKLEIENFIRTHKKNNIISCSVYSNPTNLGTVKNLNNAIQKSQGQYIVPLSGDDKFFDNTVLSQIVERLKVSKTGIITCRRLKCDIDMNPIRYMPTDGHIRIIKGLDTHAKQHSAFVRSEYYEMASGSCTYYTRDKLMKDGCFDEKYRLLEDWTHFIQITRTAPIETAYDITSICYRDGGISTKMSPVIRNDYLTIMKEEIEVFGKCLSHRDIRCIKFNYMRIETGKAIVPSLLFLDAFISRAFYKLKCKLYEKKHRNVK